jgi:hypothetical protein
MWRKRHDGSDKGLRTGNKNRDEERRESWIVDQGVVRRSGACGPRFAVVFFDSLHPTRITPVTSARCAGCVLFTEEGGVREVGMDID